MTINNKKKIADIQHEFRQLFRNLKLEFYTEPHGEGAGSPRSQKIPSNATIGEVRTVHQEGDLDIGGNLKVSELERAFADKYGLYVQVFRRSGDLWLQTITTDEWTLDRQNDAGGSTT